MNMSNRALIVRSALESHKTMLNKTIARIGQPVDRKGDLVLKQLKGELAETQTMLQEIMVNGTILYIKEKRNEKTS